MLNSIDAQKRNFNPVIVGVVASIIGGGLWVPLGSAIAIATLVYVARSGGIRSRQGIAAASLVAVMLLLTGGYVWALNTSGPSNANEAGRVQKAFKQMSADVAQKQSLSALAFVPVPVGSTSLADGSRTSLWVTNPDPLGVRSYCFYVDVTKGRSASGYSESACGEPGKEVTLERTDIGSSVIGYVGLWPASFVFVTVNGATTRLPITLGYFLLPGKLSMNPNTSFTITLMDKANRSLGTVSALVAPGGATPR
ncbi:hypothetical protein GALL_415790 [mine drainage metagenome]|uniref:Uncharacterized protein n=1 Tax=mine drainage metagenome TaxID=410659 RepID=A0A1J5Q9R3_9ZZZZ